MIVKTGANYQAEGGYIEASIKGENSIVVNFENNEIVVPNINGITDSVIPCTISKASNLSGTVTLNAITVDAPVRTGGFVISESPRSLGILFNVGCVLTVAPTAAVKLGDSSKNCTLTTEGGYVVLKATGDDPVAILEAA